MGYFTEVNTLLTLAKTGLDPKSLKLGQSYTITKNNERIFPLGLAILLVGKGWEIYGYCVIKSSKLENKQTTVTFEVLSLFSESERQIYTTRFLEAAQKTGEI